MKSLTLNPQQNSRPISVFWFRRDLRLNDNKGLKEALLSGADVLPLFIFDREILKRLKAKSDARVNFIHQALLSLDSELRELGSSLFVHVGEPISVFKKLISERKVGGVYTNRDYEPYAIQRDETVADVLAKSGISFHAFKDQVIFEQNEVVRDDCKPYTMFTPYSKKWLARLTPDDLKSAESEKHVEHFIQDQSGSVPTLESIGFAPTQIDLPPVKPQLDKKLIASYEETRNFPSKPRGTSRFGIHLRFGTISIRETAAAAKKASNTTWLKELIWREFFMQILWHFPHVTKGAFRPEYDKISFREDAQDLKAWKEGRTGFAIVDAGMRELNATGFMHNRVRMIAASVLVKHLLIDWKVGEAYFAEKLLDFELASNNGNWQWVAGSGCDASPYFRVFNPDLQQKKFDPKAEYITKWVPEYGTDRQLEPIIDPITARTRVLRAYKSALNRRAPEPRKPVAKRPAPKSTKSRSAKS
jgi:deoxyribodipyrimidine photo-lyase